jgi:hypothetical protein
MLRFELRSNFGPRASLTRIGFVPSPAFAERPLRLLCDFWVTRSDDAAARHGPQQWSNTLGTVAGLRRFEGVALVESTSV